MFAAVARDRDLMAQQPHSVLGGARYGAIGLVTISLIAPVLLKPLNILWFQFGLLLHRVVNPIVMFAMFAAVFVPAGAIMRLWRDPLRSRRTTGASTYWIERRRKRGH